MLALVAAVLAAPFAVAPVWAATTDDGSGQATVSGFVEMTATDNAVAAFSASPSSSTPGPVVSSTTDGFTFSNANSNTRGFMSAHVLTATDSAASTTKTIKGTSHTIKDWIFQRGDTATDFGSHQVVGTETADRASWTTTGLTVDSGGTVAIKTYSATSPTDGGDGTTTMYWVYDATANQYRFDTDTDFTAGATLVNPTSKLDLTSDYDITIGGNKYGVTSVGAASSYLPTLTMGWQADYSDTASTTHNVYILIDFPSGTPAGTYSYTVRGSATQLTS